MKKTRVTITLDPDIEYWLRAGAKSGSKSLSEVVRQCLRDYAETNPENILRTDKAREKSEEAWRRNRPSPVLGNACD
ncbi:hypothetical protein [Roseovarius sp. MMSF_3305]|uniref:hypothetical protein n=1 Tax=Roseovarius sp. MMSF_3305 TaxID=3046697 RepID=UPI00273F9451|nr:hypothetical protein [Roseovarius sp. MMSF_3305]